MCEWVSNIEVHSNNMSPLMSTHSVFILCFIPLSKELMSEELLLQKWSCGWIWRQATFKFFAHLQGTIYCNTAALKKRKKGIYFD